ncbi:hypothetical protein HZB94_02805 [Candidatus Falkowbacteria bacterium]|nr:hypothetical protein [Candidatus Falkowbacteria bacterium]
MKNLFIFDNAIDASSILKIKSADCPKSKGLLFPLTSNPDIINSVKSALFKKNNINPEVLPTAASIDREVDKLRERIAKLIGAAGEIIVNGVNVKQYFYIARRDVSAWWFSQLAEKNTIKNSGLFKIAQLEAIASAIDIYDISHCCIVVEDRELKQAISAICQQRKIKYIALKSKQRKNISRSKLIKRYLHQSNRLPIIFARAFLTFVCRMIRAIQVRIALGRIPIFAGSQDNGLLICSYFPCADPAKVKNGQLENKFLGKLEPLIKSIKEKIIWLWLFVYVDNRTYGDAVHLAKQLRSKGENGYLLEQFLTIAGVLRVCRQWASLAHRYLRVKTKLNAEITRLFGQNDYSVIIKKMNDRSFVGWQGLESLIYLELFCNAFKRLPLSGKCLHFAEMHTWEIALNAAKRMFVPTMETIGYVHTSVSSNYFFYFRDQVEISKNKYDYPVDDVVAANGGITASLLRQSYYPRVEEIEATRFLYLNEKLRQILPPKDNLIVVATSASRAETEEIISLVKSAFYGTNSFKIWFKGHPTLPLDGVFKKLEIESIENNFCIRQRPINELLQNAKILIVGDSAVALEALALGCYVVIPVLSAWMFMSPLKGHEEFYAKTYSVDELREKINELVLKSSQNNREKIQYFVKQYWHLDEAMTRWEKLMKQ